MNRVQAFLRKNSSTILTFLGAGGVVATSVLAVKATPKALQLIEDERYARREYSTIFADNTSYETVVLPDLTRKEIIKIAWKPYIPAILVGGSTIACIFGANYLNAKTQASLMSAYALLDSSYKEYRNKVKELYDENADINIKREMAKDRIIEDYTVSEDKELFFDFHSMNSVETTFEEVIQAERIINDMFEKRGYAYLNEYYELLGMKLVDYGYQTGWHKRAGYDEIAFEYEKTDINDDMECTIITMTTEPSSDYF